MKKLLFITLLLLTCNLVTNAHCYPAYMYTGPVTSVSGSISTSYTGNKNFRSSGSGTAIFNSGTNFNSWKRLNFETKIQVKVPINFPSGGAEVGMYGTVKFDYVNMTDSDIIYAEGKTEIVTLISNNSKVGQWNIIFTYDSIKIAGNYYVPGDTFYSTPGNKETAVIITDCRGTTLPVTLIEFKYSNKTLTWKTGVETYIQDYEVLMSKNGSQWDSIGSVVAKNIDGSEYSFKVSESGLYKLKVNEIGTHATYSPTINIKIDGPTGMSFYPNPVKDNIRIVSSTVVKSLQVYNLSGQLVKSVNFYEVSLSDLPPSLYVLKVTDESGEVFINKFVKD